MAEQLLRMEGIQKRFPGVHALNDCQFDLYAGEVHALVGENGAGKSTLMKVLNGIHKPDGGSIYYKGKPLTIHSPEDAQRLGIGMIHQELNLMPHLTVAENIFIGKEFTRGFFLNKGKANSEAEKLLRSMNLDIPATVQVQYLSVAKQQMVEIAKALSYNSDLLVMDEPTAALTESEIAELFKFIRKLRDAGKGIIYISHRLEELWQITDRVTVMRDGQYIATLPTEQATRKEIVSMMVNRIISDDRKTISNAQENAPIVLEVKNLRARNVKDVSFSLRQGEILGFAGLMGAGRTETMRALFGADPVISSEVVLYGKKVSIKSPSNAVAHRIGYLSEDRRAFGLALGLSVRDNAVMASIEDFAKGLFIDKHKSEEYTNKYIELLSIKTPSTAQLVKNLSGGNQQKIVLAKWLIRNCDIIIFDEPTRGIDVGAKSEIYTLMNELVQMGKSIIMISSDMPELLRMADRIVVMCEGRITGELSIEEATQEKIMTLATMTMK